MNNHLIIVAAGTGSRMGAELPKQFLEIQKKPILLHTLERFHSFDPKMQIVIVLHPDYADYWRDLANTLGVTIPHTIVKGGNERFDSVRNGLLSITSKQGVVGIHDAVRPLVSLKTFETCYNDARKYGSAIPVVPINDSIRSVDHGKNQIADRSKFRLVQTPQCFELSLLRKAFEQPYHPSFTDDASVVESLGISLHLVEGNRENIKITTPEDLRLAEVLLSF